MNNTTRTEQNRTEQRSISYECCQDKTILLGGLGEKISNGGTQYYNQDRVYSSFGISVAVATAYLPWYLVKDGKPRYRIRKLTDKECFRLMNFTDEDWSKAAAVNSRSQLYKQAGNSIVVAVLCAIFSQLGIQGHKKWNEMTVEERRALVYKGTILEK